MDSTATATTTPEMGFWESSSHGGRDVVIGQYLDRETGLHYNWWRYYDPDTGRYITSDPLGLAGGDPSLYAYASNNPLRFYDLNGLIIHAGSGQDAAVVMALKADSSIGAFFTALDLDPDFDVWVNDPYYPRETERGGGAFASCVGSDCVVNIDPQMPYRADLPYDAAMAHEFGHVWDFYTNHMPSEDTAIDWENRRKNRKKCP